MGKNGQIPPHICLSLNNALLSKASQFYNSHIIGPNFLPIKQGNLNLDTPIVFHTHRYLLVPPKSWPSLSQT